MTIAIEPAVETADAQVAGYPPLYSTGKQLDPAHLGPLFHSSGDEPIEALRQRMAEDGYLYLPGFLKRDDVMAARCEVTRRLAEMGVLNPAFDPMEAVIKGELASFQPGLAKNNQPLHKILYEGRLMDFFSSFLGGPARHFDFTWMRAMPPGQGTASHLDSVYMNRGTQNLFTTWTPLGDVSYELGGLMVLAGTNNNQRLKETYGAQDIDSYCENKLDAKSWGRSWGTGGNLKGSPNRIRKAVAGENALWRTTEYRAGDVLIFSIYTVHASLDNRTSDRIRLSSDTRYQLASDPVDERWVGEDPVGHGQAGKRGKIC